MHRPFTARDYHRKHTVPMFRSQLEQKPFVGEMSEHEITIFALRSGMKPADILLFLDNVARWRALGIGGK